MALAIGWRASRPVDLASAIIGVAFIARAPVIAVAIFIKQIAVLAEFNSDVISINRLGCEGLLPFEVGSQAQQRERHPVEIEPADGCDFAVGNGCGIVCQDPGIVVGRAEVAELGTIDRVFEEG